MYELEQLEDLLQILSLIELKFPLKRLGGWAASADYIKIIYREILAKVKEDSDIVIVEVGSGISTILLGYLLKRVAPNALFISLEHDIDYLFQTEKELKLHGLQNVNLIYAPLKKYLIEGKIWKWYETTKLFNILEKKKIDILAIDGPPMLTQPLARYPALVLLADYLDDNSLLILDDANREDEKKIVQLWKEWSEDFVEEYIETQKGTAVLRKTKLHYKPKISICIPTYNRMEFLQEAIESIYQQRYRNYEIVIVDDGSTDGTKEYVSSLQNDKIKFFQNKKNMGRPYTRNRCINESSGEYIVWLDDDDKLLHDTLLEYVRILATFPNVDVIYGKLKVLGENRLFIDPIDFYQNSFELINRLILDGCVIPNPGTLVRKDLYERYGLYKLGFSRAQDYEFWTRIALNAGFKKCNKIVAEYRIHQGNISVGTVLELDTSYESMIKRAAITTENIDTIFYYEENIEQRLCSLADSLANNLDMYNAIFYGFEYAMGSNLQKQLMKKFIYALKMDEVNLAKIILQKINKNEEFQEILKKYEKFSKKIAKFYKSGRFHQINEILNILEKILGHNRLSLFYTSLIAMQKGEITLAQKTGRSCYIMNPFKSETEELLRRLSINEYKDIYNRIVSVANFLEKNKMNFYNNYLKD